MPITGILDTLAGLGNGTIKYLGGRNTVLFLLAVTFLLINVNGQWVRGRAIVLSTEDPERAKRQTLARDLRHMLKKESLYTELHNPTYYGNRTKLQSTGSQDDHLNRATGHLGL
jgi:hypothetical protein